METGPILRALLRNKTGPILICLQIALTLAVVVNALFLINARLEKMARPLGIDADHMINLTSTLISTDGDAEGNVKRDMDAIRAIPGVVAATPILTRLQSGSARAEMVRADREPNTGLSHVANINYVDQEGIDAMGARLLAGRNFRADEIVYLKPNQQDNATVAIVTQTMGKALFGDQNPLGKVYYDSDDGHSVRIVGVINDVAVAWLASESPMFGDSTYNLVLLPFVDQIEGQGYNYLVRTEPGATESMIPKVEDVLYRVDKNRLIEAVRTQREILARSYGSDRAVTRILIVVALLMIAITAFGIVGLASFTVNQRRRQIGVRRALGARRTDILRYFIAENLLLTTFGVVVGVILTLGFHLFLFNLLKIPKLPLAYLPIGVAIMYLLGLIAVYGPARRASMVSPAIATRSV